MKSISYQLLLVFCAALLPQAARGQVTNFPSIVTQPASQTVACHGSVTFTVVATGAPPLSYNWTAEGLPVGFPATNSTLTVTNVLFRSGTQFRVVVTNSFGAVASEPAVLTVTPSEAPALSITTAGLSNIIAWPQECGPFTLRFAASLSDFMTNWVRVTAPFWADQTNNYVGVTNLSTEFYQLQTILPVIATQPVSQTASIGSTVTFSVVATNPPCNTPHPLSYIWHLNGIELPTQTNSTLVLSNVQRLNGGSYSVAVANDLDAVVSDIATLKVDSSSISSIALADNLSDRAVLSNLTNALNGSNIGATKEPFEPRHAGELGGKSVWLGWTALTNGIATFDTIGSAFDTVLAVYTNTVISNLVLVASDDDSGGFYTSRVQFNAVAGQEYEIAIDGFAGDSGDISLNWALEFTTNQIPQIVFQPQSRTVELSNSVSFVVGTAPSLSPLTYQWRHNGSDIPGATTTNYVISNALLSSIGTYSVVVTNNARSVESAPALLQLLERSDTNVTFDSGLQLIDKLDVRDVPQPAVQILTVEESPLPGNLLIVGIPVGGSVTLTSQSGGLTQGSDITTCGRYASGTLHALIYTPSVGTLNVSANGALWLQLQLCSGARVPCPPYGTYVSARTVQGCYYVAIIGTSGPGAGVSLSASVTP